MKATRYLFTALSLAVLALSACTNDDLPGGNTLPEGAVHITAGIEGVQTPRRAARCQWRRLIRVYRHVGHVHFYRRCRIPGIQ